jgi:pimeloyl-ACP methyl ester carboxylesterase
MTRPTLVFLHALGASGREWDQVAALLPDADCLTLDLPGFGDNMAAGYADVAEMADWLADTIRQRHLTACVLIGHSMGGKIATLVAARAASGEVGLAGVLGVVLVAASPLSPEPMDEDRRAGMLAQFAVRRPTRDEAAGFIDANTATRLSEPQRTRAIEDVLRSNPEAWRGWLERGSLEDWSSTAPRIDIPALVVAGAEDGDLGVEAQRELNLPRYADAELCVLADAAHLIPYEQPAALAALIDRHVDRVAAVLPPAEFTQLLGSARVSRRTRAAMLARMRPAPVPAAGWNEAQRATVAALIAHILPDTAAAPDLPLRVEASLARGEGDGWRFATLPPDAEAWRRGIATLDAISDGFVAADHAVQADWLDRIAAGEAGIADDATFLSPAQMALWFQDARAEVVRVWMSLPSTMAAIGYDGFAVGGDGARKQGYVRTAADDSEAWQLGMEHAA